MKTTVTVTQDDIDGGIQEDSCGCPIALAARRALGVVALVHVEADEAWTFIPGGISAELPPEARAFITAFDGGMPVKPLAFDLTWTAEGEDQ